MVWKILIVESAEESATALELSRQLVEMDVLGLGAPDDALTRLAQAGFDVLIVDLDDPKLTGLLLLEHAGKLYPAMLRVALATQGPLVGMLTEGEQPMAHHFLAKPVDVETLVQVVRDAVLADRSSSLAREERERLRRRRVALEHLRRHVEQDAERVSRPDGDR